MKVLFLEPLGEMGGAERSLLDLMYALREAYSNIRMYLICGTDGPLVQQTAALGGEVTILPMPESLVSFGDSGLSECSSAQSLAKFAYRALSALRASRVYAEELGRTVAAIEPDLVHSNGIKFHVLARLANIPTVPIIFHLRDFQKTRVLVSHAMRWASHRANHLIAISQSVADEARLELAQKPISVVYNAIDTNAFHPGDQGILDLDRLAGLVPAEPGTIRFGLVASYARWKGHMQFLEAAAQALTTKTKVPRRFYVIGGSIYRTQGSQVTVNELRNRIEQLSIGDSVGLIGFRSDIAEVYRSLDVVVHASTSPEPFGRTIAEAMSTGKPIIVSKAGGASELFVDRESGVGISPSDTIGLANAMNELAENSEMREKLGVNARQVALERFSRARLSVDMISIYSQILSRTASSSIKTQA